MKDIKVMTWKLINKQNYFILSLGIVSVKSHINEGQILFIIYILFVLACK